MAQRQPLIMAVPTQTMLFPQVRGFGSNNRNVRSLQFYNYFQNDDGKHNFTKSMAALAFGSMFLAIYMNGSSPKAEAEGAKEVEVSFASELHDGDKRVLKVGEKDDDVVLIAKYQGKIYAVGNFCSHFGVPLDGGVLFDDKVLCPAHAAGFSIITGQPDGGPGLDGLPSFPVV